MDSSCNRFYSLNSLNNIECSGHGTCFNASCYCNPSWTSRTDYFLDEHFDCDINILSIRIIGYIFILLACINIFIVYRQHPNYRNIGIDNKTTIYFAFTVG